MSILSLVVFIVVDGVVIGGDGGGVGVDSGVGVGGVGGDNGLSVCGICVGSVIGTTGGGYSGSMGTGELITMRTIHTSFFKVKRFSSN